MFTETPTVPHNLGDVKGGPLPAVSDMLPVERYTQTVDVLDIKRVIDAVNPSTRKKRAKKET